MNDVLTTDTEAKKTTIMTLEPLKAKTKRKFNQIPNYILIEV